jgi:gamma-glutamylcyclotransferase (GGCT)/AIG2-like uncharacterized protein YtfP
MTTAVFVYGTLKQGQCREHHWPHRPRSIQAAWVAGTLYTRHDYPAMRRGDDRVLGEFWQFDPAAIPAVLATLDQVEGTNQPGQPDLYQRFVAPVIGLDGRPLGNAWCYRYAIDPTGDGFTPVKPPADGDDFVRWP